MIGRTQYTTARSSPIDGLRLNLSLTSRSRREKKEISLISATTWVEKAS